MRRAPCADVANLRQAAVMADSVVPGMVVAEVVLTEAVEVEDMGAVDMAVVGTVGVAVAVGTVRADRKGTEVAVAEVGGRDHDKTRCKCAPLRSF